MAQQTTLSPRSGIILTSKYLYLLLVYLTQKLALPLSRKLSTLLPVPLSHYLSTLLPLPLSRYISTLLTYPSHATYYMSIINQQYCTGFGYRHGFAGGLPSLHKYPPFYGWTDYRNILQSHRRWWRWRWGD